jgi:hypothetical protein
MIHGQNLGCRNSRQAAVNGHAIRKPSPEPRNCMPDPSERASTIQLGLSLYIAALHESGFGTYCPFAALHKSVCFRG